MVWRVRLGRWESPLGSHKSFMMLYFDGENLRRCGHVRKLEGRSRGWRGSGA